MGQRSNTTDRITFPANAVCNNATMTSSLSLLGNGLLSPWIPTVLSQACANGDVSMLIDWIQRLTERTGVPSTEN